MNVCWRYEDGKFVTAVNPLDSALDEAAAFSKAGYFEQMRNPAEPDSGKSVATIYQHTDGNDGIPCFLISIGGNGSEMALLIADDFNHLLVTLAAIKPLASYVSDFPD